MAKKKYKNGPKGVSFKGTFVFPKLSEPDYGSDDYPKHDGEFSTKLRGRLDDPKVKEFIALYQPMHDAVVARAKEAFKKLKPEVRKKLEKVTVNPLYSTIYDEDEKETGEIEIKFAMKYSGQYKSGPKEGETWYRVPAIFDASGQRIKYFNFNNEGEPQRVKNAPAIWGGTVGRIAFEVGIDKEEQPGYFIPATGAAGLSFKLEAARIVELVTKGERSASSYFGDADEEGGFVYGDEADASAADEDATDKPAVKAKAADAAADDDADF